MTLVKSNVIHFPFGSLRYITFSPSLLVKSFLSYYVEEVNKKTVMDMNERLNFKIALPRYSSETNQLVDSFSER
jgi:hypothetical protein